MSSSMLAISNLILMTFDGGVGGKADLLYSSSSRLCDIELGKADDRCYEIGTVHHAGCWCVESRFRITVLPKGRREKN